MVNLSQVTGSKDGQNYNIATTPLYFVRSGYIDIDNGRLWYASISGCYWPSSAASTIWGNAGFGARYLDFDASGVRPSNGPTARWLGLPLRYLAINSIIVNPSTF